MSEYGIFEVRNGSVTCTELQKPTCHGEKWVCHECCANNIDLFALTSARFCARARRRFSPQNRALGLSVFGNHIVVAKLVEAARAKLFSHRTARIERFENYPFMTDDHKSSFMITLFTFAKYYLFL